MNAAAGSGEPDLVYPEEEVVGETVLHLLIRQLLRDLVERRLSDRGERAFVGSDQFLYWVPGSPQHSVAPDVYVLPGVDPGALLRSVKLWEHAVRPSFVAEIVSDDIEKDYVHGPIRYGEIRVDELVIHDPEPARGVDRVRWQVYRRRGDSLVLEERTDGDRVRSEVLGCWLRVVQDAAGRPIVRLATGPGGDDVLPTGEEIERAAKERERAAKEEAVAQRLALEAEIAELRRRLGE